MLLLVGLVFGARTLVQIGARRFRGTFLGQVLAALKESSENAGASVAGPGPAKRPAALSRCSKCGDHVPRSGGGAGSFVCDRCLGQAPEG